MEPKRIYGLIGRPLGHSFSQAYFTDFFNREHINAEYRNFELEDVGDIMELISEYPQLKGLNITSPYKELIVPYCDVLTDDAKAIGAVNCLRIDGSANDLRFTGTNTDCSGFAADIRPFLPAESPHKALLLGTGGASKAVRAAMESLGWQVLTVSRSSERADLTYSQLSDSIILDNKVIINCTPLGMATHTDYMPQLPYQFITPHHLCYDLVYNPCPTLFMRECASRGAAVKGGLGMLVNQAVESWNFWNLDNTDNK